LITARDRTNPETLLDKAHNALQGMRSTGTGMAGEISTTGLTRKLFSASKLAGIWFHEKLGSHTEESLANRLTPSPAPARQQYSLAGHAPHTTSPQLLVRLKDITRARQLPFSIHLAESCDESEFIETGKGAWANFLMERGIDFSSWGLPAGSPVQYLARLGLLDPQTIAVHLIRADHKDMDILRQSGTRIGLCLRSNQNLHARLPDVGLMFQKGLRPCLGTDSLASTNSLNMFDEMAFVTAHFPELGPGRIFSMATVNGAQALGFEHLSGTLAPGKFGPMMYLPLTDGTTSTLLEKIVHADFTGECVFVQDID
jgi:cytosine/adenosine deaminase-related metal-dependent hydrolase